MSPKRQVNHNIRKHFNTIIYNISRYAEIALSMVILLVIALAGFRLIMEVADTSVPVWYSPVQTRQSLLSAYNPLLHTMAPQILLHEHRIQNPWDCPSHVRNHIQSPLQFHPDSDMGHSPSMNRIICPVPLYRRLPVSDNLASLIQVQQYFLYSPAIFIPMNAKSILI